MYTLSVINDEHKGLFSMCVSIENNLGKVLESESISAISELLNAVQRHFAHEEAMMKDLIYFDYDAHKEVHIAFVRMAAELYNSMLADPTYISDVIRIIKNWLITHTEVEALLFPKSFTRINRQ